ncbi:MAG: HDOD domain-containing protein [Desulfobacterales bacterium]|nr:HDOD domain-containing protein [Desulfobacterales bacterium]
MKILIVDDEHISRKVLVKQLDPLGSCTEVNNAKEALMAFATAHQEKAPYDLVTLDVSMPGMDGRKVLENMRRHEQANQIPKAQQTRIIMVSSRMNISLIKECIQLGCNGYLTKPVSRYQLLEAMTKAGIKAPEPTEADAGGHSQVVAEVIKQFYKGQTALPVFPDIVNEVEALIHSEDASINALEKIVERDIIISSRLISIANSPLYKGVGKADSLNAALVRLGLKAAHQVVTSVAAKSLFDTEEKQLATQLNRLWMHSFATACIARGLGQQLGVDNLDNLFLMGIIHDIGKVLLLKAYVDLAQEPDLGNIKLKTAIHEIHTTFGAVLLKKLRFSPPFVQVAEFHHWNIYTQDCAQELIIINLANHLTQKIGFGFMSMGNRDEQAQQSIEELTPFKQLGLDLDSVKSILKESKSIILQTAGTL